MTDNTERNEVSIGDNFNGRKFTPLGGGVYRVSGMERSAMTGLYKCSEASDPASVTGGRVTDGASKGYRSPRTIRTLEEFELLPDRAVVRDSRDVVMEKFREFGWFVTGRDHPVNACSLPAVVLWEPNA